MTNSLSLTGNYLISIPENIYFAKVKIQAGEYEKSSKMLISAPTQKMAEDYACYCESHDTDTLEWNTNGCVADLNWEFAYTASCEPVDFEHVSVLKEYMGIHYLSINDLLKSNDYPETLNLPDYALAVSILINQQYQITGNFLNDLSALEQRIATCFKEGESPIDLTEELADIYNLPNKEEAEQSNPCTYHPMVTVQKKPPCDCQC